MANSEDKWKYDAFISFRGEDTCRNFTDHLYSALCRRGINTFKDDQRIERGSAISDEIYNAIKNSQFLIVVFSSNYASSRWCLDELAKIWESWGTRRQVVLPVFYDVETSQVQKQTGRFGEAFAAQEQDLETGQRWRVAMTEVANLSGWDIKDRCESQVINGIVDEIWKKLCYRDASMTEDLVGIHSEVDELIHSLSASPDEVKVLGICGMGGIGKTTIAKVIYEKISGQFEGSTFVAKVREVAEKYGLVRLQEQIISEILMEKDTRVWDSDLGISLIKKRICTKKVLIVLDDVDQLDQIQSLVGMRNWFCNGSRIIITTRNEHLLTSYGEDEIHRVEELNHDEALRLFCLKAFKNDYPADEFVELSHHFVKYANGLPLALVVLGSFLFGRSESEWSNALVRLKEIPNKQILEKLEISFDGLEEVEKNIFLDIACFHNGKSKDYVMKVLECSELYSEIGVRVLLNKSLVTISQNKVQMHDLLQQLGREIVRRSSPKEPGRRSRLWTYEDIHQVFTNDTGTDEVEGIVLDLAKQMEGTFNAKAFMKMKRLRLLKLRNLQLSRSLEFLPNNLKYLEWHGYPFKMLPPNFNPCQLVELHLRHSHIDLLWKKIQPLQKLKCIDLSYSENLRRTPDFRMVPNLERLDLEGCTRPYEVHHSIGVLKKLVSLNIKNCKSLTILPDSICNLNSLKSLILSGCSQLSKLPDRLGSLKCLQNLDLANMAIIPQPASVHQSNRISALRESKVLEQTKSRNLLLLSRFSSQRNIQNLSPLYSQVKNVMPLMLPSLSSFCHLTNLNLSNCNLIEGTIPNDISSIYKLEELDLSGNDFVSLPIDLNCLSSLKVFIVNNCQQLESLPELPQMQDLQFSGNFEYIITNCPKLIPSQGYNFFDIYGQFKLSIYKHPQGFFRYFMYCLRGTKLPEWFSHQVIGSLLRIDLPSHWVDKCVGIATSSLHRIHVDSSDRTGEETRSTDLEPFKLECALRFSNQRSKTTRLILPVSSDPFPDLDQLGFLYFPKMAFYRGTDEYWWNKCSHVDVIFTSTGLEVQNCGVRFIYEDDLEQLSQPFEGLDILKTKLK